MKRYQIISNDYLVICVTADSWGDLIAQLKEQELKPISIVELA